MVIKICDSPLIKLNSPLENNEECCRECYEDVTIKKRCTIFSEIRRWSPPMVIKGSNLLIITVHDKRKQAVDYIATTFGIFISNAVFSMCTGFSIIHRCLGIKLYTMSGGVWKRT
jgi:hypothetical protein